jgi:3-oxoadipate enol-lactonase
LSEAHLSGIKIHYKVEGSGAPLVLIGGFDSPLQTWQRQVAYFKKYFKVITFDARGTGRSSKPGGPYSVQVMAEDVIGLLDTLKIEKASILGVSLGGLVAQEIAIRFPERVSKLVLGSTFASISKTSGPTPEMVRIITLPFYRMLDGMAGLMLNRSSYRLALLPVAYVKNRMANRAAILGKREAAYHFDSSSRLSGIRVSTLVLTGSADRVILPSSSEVIKNLIPGSKVVMIEGGSHLFFIEKAGLFNRAVLDFLLDR